MEEEEIAEESARAFLHHDETFGQFFSRVDIRPLMCGIPMIDKRCVLRQGSCLELCGLSGVGKTEILYHIACTCILPDFQDGVHYGGYGAEVVLYDLDCKFDAVRLAHILQSRIIAARRDAGASVEDTDLIGQMVHSAASHLRVIFCPSSFHFLAALKVSRPLMTELASNGKIAAVLIDNITAHYYPDRDAKGALAGEKGRAAAPLILNKVHDSIAYGLKAIQCVHKIPIIATKHIFSMVDASHPRESMTKSWQDMVTHTLFLQRRNAISDEQINVRRRILSSEEKIEYYASWLKPSRSQEEIFWIGESGIGFKLS